MGKKRIKSSVAATKMLGRELVEGLLVRKRISWGLTCETLRSTALLVLQLWLAREVEGDLDVFSIVNSEYVETLTPGHLQVMKVKVRGQNTWKNALYLWCWKLESKVKLAQRAAVFAWEMHLKVKTKGSCCFRPVVHNLTFVTIKMKVKVRTAVFAWKWWSRKFPVVKVMMAQKAESSCIWKWRSMVELLLWKWKWLLQKIKDKVAAVKVKVIVAKDKR